MIDAKKLLAEIEKEMTLEARSVFLRYGRDAARDGREFLSAIETDIEQWIAKLDSGALSREGYIALVNGAKELAGMPALKRKGIGRVMINEFRDRMAEMIIDRTLGMLA
jgi:GNAT superfamily N-acetyltransferase